MGLVVIGGVDYVCTCMCTDMHTCREGKERKRRGDFFSSWTWNEKMMIYLELDLGEEDEEEDISTSI